MGVVAITGVNSYFASTVLCGLEANPEVERIVGIDVTPWKMDLRKVTFYQEDVRSPTIGELFQGVDTVLHLAFVVGEIHDKKKTHEINVDGSLNVFRACAAHKVRKIIYTSSIAAYGAHPDNPTSITEDYPLVENRDSYYSSDKVTVEKFLQGFSREHPEIIITIFRPPIVVGPHLNNFAVDVFTRRITFSLRGRETKVQFLHESDLGRALALAIQRDIPGVFNIAADDFTDRKRLHHMVGAKVIELPPRVVRSLANLLFFLRLEKMSQGWVSLMEYPIVVSNEKFKAVSGWQPQFSTEGAFRDFVNAWV